MAFKARPSSVSFAARRSIANDEIPQGAKRPSPDKSGLGEIHPIKANGGGDAQPIALSLSV